MRPPKPCVTFYGVYLDQFDRPALGSAAGSVSYTGNVVQFRRPATCFNWRTRVPVGEAHPSPEAAIDAFVAAQRREADALRARAVACEKAADRARELRDGELRDGAGGEATPVAPEGAAIAEGSD